MPHWVWNFFATDGTNFNGSNKRVWCRAELTPVLETLIEEDQLALSRHELDSPRTEHVLIGEATNTLGPERALCSKIDSMLRHLRDKCVFALPELKQQAADELIKRRTIRNPTNQSSNTSTSRLNSGPATGIPLGASAINSRTSLARVGSDSTILLTCAPLSEARFTLDKQREFAADLLHVFIACGFPFSAASNAVFKNFFSKYVPGAQVPGRQVLAGRILNEQVAKAEDFVMQQTTGKLAMGQCDGWKNVSRTPVIAVMMSVEGHPYALQVHNIGAASKTAENLVELMRLNMEFAIKKYNVEWIGWCTDAGGDARKARKLAYKAYPWLICPDCWAHQVNLIIGDYFKLRLQFMHSANKAQEVIKWFNNHSRALGLLHVEQVHTLGKKLALIYAVPTRWTSVYQSLNRLIECIRPLRAIAVSQRDALLYAGGRTPKSKQATMEVLETLTNESFWMDITRTVLHLAPLCIASHITQTDATRLDHVLLLLAHLSRLYRTMPGVDSLVRDGICTSIEKRWAACDQDVFILAVFFNPYIRGDVFTKSNVDFNPAGIFTLVLRIWARLFRRPIESVPPGLRRATIDYYARKAEFSNDRMHLDLAAKEAQEQGTDIDIVDIWHQLDTNCFESGRNWLVMLAIRILSVVANSAGCERLFSAMGLVHSNTRNRLDLERVCKSVYLRSVLQREQELLGWSRPRAKRRIDVVLQDDSSDAPNIEEVDQGAYSSPPEDADAENANLEVNTQHLIDDAAADIDDVPDAMNSFSRPKCIRLADLFAFPPPSAGHANSSPSEQYINSIWMAGLRNLGETGELMSILQTEADDGLGEDSELV